MYIYIVKEVLCGKSVVNGRIHFIVHKIINKFRYEGAVKNILSEYDEGYVAREIKIKLTTNVPKLPTDDSSRLSKPVKGNREGYHGRVPRRKPYISKASKLKCLQFAKHVNFYNVSGKI